LSYIYTVGFCKLSKILLPKNIVVLVLFMMYFFPSLCSIMYVLNR